MRWVFTLPGAAKNLQKTTTTPLRIHGKTIENPSKIHLKIWKSNENPLKIHWNVIENPLKKCPEKWLELCSNLIDFWSFWAPFCLHFGSFLGHFGSFWTPPGVPGETSQFSSLFGTFLVSILAPFWCHFGSQNQHFSSQKLHRFFDWFLEPFCLHFASQNPHRNPPKMNQQICPKIYTFFDWFLIDFAMIFQTIFKQFPMNLFRRGKCRNLRFTRKFSSGSRVGAFGIHQQFIQKSSKKRSKNSIGFAWIFGRFFIQKTSQNPSKNRWKISRKID